MKVDDETLKKIEKDYKSGFTYKRIQKKYNLTFNELMYLINSKKWRRESNRSEVQKGNQNAKGNKGGPGAEKGNKRAVVTGEFESIYSEFYSEDEKKIAQMINIENQKEKIKEQYELLIIRENRMLKRIKVLMDSNKDLTIDSIQRTKSCSTALGGNVIDGSVTYAESTLEKIQRIEEALTRIQEAKRRCIEFLHKINVDDKKYELQLKEFELKINDSENEYEDTSETDSDIYGKNN